VSKLAHSDNQSMRDIEMRNRGLVNIPSPTRLKCSFVISRKHYHTKPITTCSRYGRWATKEGRQYCNMHAEQIAIIKD
jgi:hypothetical protein